MIVIALLILQTPALSSWYLGALEIMQNQGNAIVHKRLNYRHVHVLRIQVLDDCNNVPLHGLMLERTGQFGRHSNFVFSELTSA